MSLNIDPQVERDLAELAGMKDMTVNALLREFTAEQKRYWQERAEDLAAIDHYRETGEGMSQEDMHVKMDKMRRQARKLAGTMD